jgi:two-component system, response regulator, stage 0 sporulation protein F
MPVAVGRSEGACKRLARILMSVSAGVDMIQQFAYPVATLARNIPDNGKNLTASRILVVDDERLVRWAIAETLAAQGYEITEACDAESARRAILAADPRPDVVFLDLRLPDSSDLGLANFIRTHAPRSRIILMTAYGTPELLVEAAALGIPIIAKPFDMNDLSLIVDGARVSRPV